MTAAGSLPASVPHPEWVGWVGVWRSTRRRQARPGHLQTPDQSALREPGATASLSLMGKEKGKKGKER